MAGWHLSEQARAPYVGTEHLVVAMLWQDTFVGAHELRRLGVSYARAAGQLTALPHRERAERIDPLEETEVPTPAVAMLGELARQQAGQHPIEGWEEFRVTDQQHEVIRGRFHEVNKALGPQGVRFMFGKNLDDPEWSLVRIHPGDSGLDARQVLDRLLGPAP